MYILGNQHAKVTLSHKRTGLEASRFDSEAKASGDLPWVGSLHAACSLNEGHAAGLSGQSAIAEGAEYREVLRSISNQTCQIRKDGRMG